jgi:photosystem II stability/assembly factor-like uncharacterized protein
MATSYIMQAQVWYPVLSATQKNLNTISFPSATVGYIGGDDSLLLKTTDGGLSWNPVNFTGVTFSIGGSDIQNLQFLTEDVGYMIVGPYSGSYKTTDGGLTWALLPTAGNLCFFKGLYFFNQNEGFVGGSGCFQSEIIDRYSFGTWTNIVLNNFNFNPADIVTDIDFYNSSFGLASSHSGYIFRTTDGGLNWDTVSTPDLQNPVTSVLIVNDTLAYAGYESVNVGFGLYISTNGGLSWSQDINSATFFYPDFLCLHRSGNGKIYTGGHSQGAIGLIFESPGDIVSWNYNIVDYKINDISSYNDSIVFAVGDSGYIVANKLFTVNTTEITGDGPDINIYPNPASRILNIAVPADFDTATGAIKLYSVLGELKLSTAFTREVDVSGLQRGVYFIEIVSDSGSTRRSVIVQ